MIKFRWRKPSIAKHLAVWYTLLSVALLISFGGVMYASLKDRLRTEDDQVLASKIAELRAIIAAHANDYSYLHDEIEREATTSPGTFLRVSNGRGDIIAESGIQVDFSSLLKESTAETGRDWRSESGNTYRVLSSKFIGEGGELQFFAAMDLAGENRLLSAYWRTLMFAILAAMLAAAVIGYVIARRGMQPVSQLAAIVDKLDADTLHHRVSIEPWPQELQPLAEKFDGLLSRLETSFARLSQFSADIAHELRTPLHILRSEAEFALIRGKTQGDYRQCIESAAEEYERLSRMVEGLLFLARSEQPDAQLNGRELQLNQEIATVANFYQALADEQEVSLTYSGVGQVYADPDLFRRALGNLIANAIAHTPSHGTVAVVADARVENEVAIRVIDNGCGIDATHLPHILDRFYRVDGARQRLGEQIGLGLSIVASIMKLHQGTIAIDSKMGYGTTVTLTFPTKKPI